MSIKIIQRKALDLVSILCLWFQSIMRSLVGFLLCKDVGGRKVNPDREQKTMSRNQLSLQTQTSSRQLA